MKPLGVLLAGGASRRMGGGDKSLQMLAGRPILAHTIDRIRPQLGVTLLNANGDASRFANWGLPIVPDIIEGFLGPLAGIHAGMEWARENMADLLDIVSIPTDLPFLPLNLVAALQSARSAAGTEIAIATRNGRRHPAVGLWPIHLAQELRDAMTHENLRRVDDFVDRYRVALADFSIEKIDPFFNINSPADLAEAEALLRAD